MKAKLRQMERLRQLREARQRFSEAAVAAAAGKLREAERIVAEVKAMEAAEKVESQRALEAGEGEAWRLSVALRWAEGMDRARREMVWGERRREMLVAERALDQCRMETEQAKSLQRGVQEALRIADERRRQAVSDDRFLAQRRWVKERNGVKPLMEGGE